MLGVLDALPSVSSFEQPLLGALQRLAAGMIASDATLQGTDVHARRLCDQSQRDAQCSVWEQYGVSEHDSQPARQVMSQSSSWSMLGNEMPAAGSWGHSRWASHDDMHVHYEIANAWKNSICHVWGLHARQAMSLSSSRSIPGSVTPAGGG